MPLAVKRLNNLPIMEVKYSLLKMHVSLSQMPFGSLQTLTTLSQSLGTQSGLGWPAALPCFVSCSLPRLCWATQRRVVGTVQGGGGTVPLVWLEKVRPGLRTASAWGIPSHPARSQGRSVVMKMELVPWGRGKWHQSISGLCQVRALEWWIMPVIAHVARL